MVAAGGEGGLSKGLSQNFRKDCRKDFQKDFQKEFQKDFRKDLHEVTDGVQTDRVQVYLVQTDRCDIDMGRRRSGQTGSR